MSSRYRTAVAFRQALEQRLKSTAFKRGIPLNSLRLKITIERLLARLFFAPAPPWLLKGGYAMELRYRPNARTTTDVDLSMPAVANVAEPISRVREMLQEVASLDLTDFFVFQIGAASSELQGAPQGGARFPVVASVAGRMFARFHVDVGMGDVLSGKPERLTGDDLLDFAEVPPASVLAVPRAQQFAEKIHAMTFPWRDRSNTRSRDLVDLLMFIERAELDAAEVRVAVERTFKVRRTHEVPKTLPEPPETWTKEFAAMAVETTIDASDLQKAHQRLSEYWKALWENS